MPATSHCPNDHTLDLVAKFYRKYGWWLTPIEADILQFLIDRRITSYGVICDYLWPDEDLFEVNLLKRLQVHVYHLRKKLGANLDMVTIWRQGLFLSRLGPENNPLHERKYLS